MHYALEQKNLYAMSKSCVDKKKLWTDVIGLPYYLWLEVLRFWGKRWGNGLLEFDDGCLDFTRKDLFKLII